VLARRGPFWSNPANFVAEQDVYIAGVTTRLPRLFGPEESMDVLYPVATAGPRLNQLARRAARGVGIAHRPSVLAPEAWPKRVLAKDEYRPIAWCRSMLEELAQTVPLADIGFLSVAYNISSDPDVLPSLSARLASALGLALEVPPEERAFLGCAGGLFSLDGAVRHCRRSNKAAALCSFDQCSWIVNPIHDTSRSDHKDHLRTSMLFADGAAATVVIPGALRHAIPGPRMRILATRCEFVPDDSAWMHDGYLVLSKGLELDVPRLVADRLVRPLLAEHGMTASDVHEWALHQGGRAMLDRFADPDTLGLSPAQLQRASDLFHRYGNFSGPSCMFVLDSFFREDASDKHGRRGMLLAFGAGIYMSAALYEWECR
jgi:predicted naringenin-chalcone synthase